LPSADKVLDESQKRKKRKVLDKSRDFVRITHRVEQRQKQDKVLSKSSKSDHTRAKNTSTKIKNFHFKRNVILQEADQLDQALSLGREISMLRLSTTLLAKPLTSDSILSTALRYS
jgi:hypothetical protein